MRSSSGHSDTEIPVPTHADIASRVATHREAVTRELNALDRDGVIARRTGVLVIGDVARFARLVEKGLEEWCADQVPPGNGWRGPAANKKLG